MFFQIFWSKCFFLDVPSLNSGMSYLVTIVSVRLFVWILDSEPTPPPNFFLSDLKNSKTRASFSTFWETSHTWTTHTLEPHTHTLQPFTHTSTVHTHFNHSHTWTTHTLWWHKYLDYTHIWTTHTQWNTHTHLDHIYTDLNHTHTHTTTTPPTPEHCNK